MNCYVCDREDVILPSPDGLYSEAQSAVCPECGVIQWISIDESGDYAVAYVSTEEKVADKGQPRCDGSHCGGGGAIKEFHGSPCRWDCKRVIG